MLSHHTTPYAYADNLEYHCLPRHVRQAADANQLFHTAWRQNISYSKSWSWATSKSGRVAWEAYNIGQPRDKQFSIKNSGIDLGTVANYTGFRYTENQDARITEGTRRAFTLSRFPLSAENTVKSIHASILPHALHGCEGLFPSLKKLSHLRTAFTACLIDNKSCANPWMACACMTSRICDPLFYVATCILRLRRKMIGTHPDVAHMVWENALHLKEHFSSHARAHRPGPASALSRLTELLHCTMKPNGVLVNPDGITLDLCQVSKPDITDFLLTTWSHVVTIEILKRKTWQEIDTVDVARTIQHIQELTLSDWGVPEFCHAGPLETLRRGCMYLVWCQPAGIAPRPPDLF